MRVNAEGDFSRHHWVRLAPKRLDENAANAARLDFNTFYLKEFRSILDNFMNATTDNSKSMLKLFQQYQKVFKFQWIEKILRLN